MTVSDAGSEMQVLSWTNILFKISARFARIRQGLHPILYTIDKAMTQEIIPMQHFSKKYISFSVGLSSLWDL